MRLPCRALSFVLALLAVGCRGPVPGPPHSPGSEIRFRDVAAQAGLAYRWGHHGKSPLTILDSLGHGCAFLDYDGDGLQDLLLVSDHDTAVFRNLGGGRFENATS